MDRVLILGAGGNLGGILMDDFKEDYDVIAWDKENIDITDKDLVINKIREIKPDFIINTASYNAVDRCEKNNDEYELAQKINGEAVGFLADVAIEIDAVLVHYSTDYVFDGKNKGGYKEDDKTGPINQYGKTKQMGEQEIIKRSGLGLKWYLIRTSKLFGPKGSNEGAKPSFFDIVLKLAKEKDSLKMVHNEEISCFTYTRDLSKATKDLIETNQAFDIYHITNTEACSWYEAAKYLLSLEEINNVKIEPITSKEYIRKARRPKYSVLLNTKLNNLRSYKEALKEYLNKN